MNFAQTFRSTANTMKFLFAISVVSVCLLLVTARFVHFISLSLFFFTFHFFIFTFRKLKKSWMQEMIMRSLASLICHLDQARYSSLHVSLAERDAIGITIAVALPVWDGNALWLIPCENLKRRHKWHLIVYSIHKQEKARAWNIQWN